MNCSECKYGVKQRGSQYWDSFANPADRQVAKEPWVQCRRFPSFEERKLTDWCGEFVDINTPTEAETADHVEEDVDNGDLQQIEE